MQLETFKEIEKNIEKWKELYISNKKAQNYSNHTIRAYSRILDDFSEFCYLERIEIKDEYLSFKDMNKYFINNFITYLKDEKHLSDKSIEFYINVIKNFFKFISEENEDAIDILTPIEKISIKVKQTEAAHYTNEEIPKIESYLRELIRKSKVLSKIRNATAILFLIYTGLRAKELLELKKEDIVLEDDMFKIVVNGKGEKERIIYIDKDMILNEYEKLLEYLDTDKIFDIAYITLYNYNRRLCQKLNIKHKGLHAYRHYLAIKAVENDINLQTISEWLGHSNITITSKYYAKANEKAKKGMAKKLV